MALAIVTGPTSAIDGGGTTATVNMTVTAGNHLVALADWYHIGTLDTVTCTSESNLTILGTAVRNATIANKALQFAYLGQIANSGAKSIVATWSTTGDMRLTVFEVSGGDTTNFSDGAPQGATGNGTTASVGLTTGTSGCAIFALCSANGSDPTPDTGYTVITLTNEQWFDGGQYDLDVGANGSKTVQMTTSSDWVIAAAAFRVAGGAAGGVPKTSKLTLLGVG